MKIITTILIILIGIGTPAILTYILHIQEPYNIFLGMMFGIPTGWIVGYRMFGT